MSFKVKGVHFLWAPLATLQRQSCVCNTIENGICCAYMCLTIYCYMHVGVILQIVILNCHWCTSDGWSTCNHDSSC